MFKFTKNNLVDSLMGAAEKMKVSHLSSPRFYFILLKTNFFARLHPLGRGPPFNYAYVPSAALLLAQSAIFRLRPVV